jgi:AGZA family xanthine/uracil permease-like MFS transporter
VLAYLIDRFHPNEAHLVRIPETWFGLPDLSTIGQANLLAGFRVDMLGLVFAFMMSDFFDTMGSVVAVANQGKFLDANGRLPGLRRVLLVDSFGAMWGGFCGASSVTTYIESAAGVNQGGRTGLVCVVAAGLFLVSLVLSPLIGMVPAAATAPALAVVGLMMVSELLGMQLEFSPEGIGGALIALLIPLTQSISFGIGVGMVAYVVFMIASGKGKSINPWMAGIAVLFLVYFRIGGL